MKNFRIWFWKTEYEEEAFHIQTTEYYLREKRHGRRAILRNPIIRVISIIDASREHLEIDQNLPIDDYCGHFEFSGLKKNKILR